MKVRAIKPGFFDGERKRVGDVFELGDKKPGKWMVPANAAMPVTPKGGEAPPAGTAEAVKWAAKRKNGGKAGVVAALDVVPDGGATGDKEVI